MNIYILTKKVFPLKVSLESFPNASIFLIIHKAL